MLHAKTEDGICFITTANLDGETNLKVNTFKEAWIIEFVLKIFLNKLKKARSVPKNLSELDTITKLASFEAIIKVDSPNESLYQTKGSLFIGKNT